jgi:hypothetical protein
MSNVAEPIVTEPVENRELVPERIKSPLLTVVPPL